MDSKSSGKLWKDIISEKALEPDAFANLDKMMDGFSLDKTDTPPEPIQVEKKKEAGAKLLMIRDNEKKWRAEMELETASGFYFQIVFKSPDAMQEFCKDKGIKLEYGSYCFIEDVLDKFK